MLSLDSMFEKLQTGEKIHDAPRQPVHPQFNADGLKQKLVVLA